MERIDFVIIDSEFERPDEIPAWREARPMTQISEGAR
jgi:hypothetical protein